MAEELKNSKDMNGSEAIEVLGGLKNREEVMIFIEGEERKTVLAAADKLVAAFDKAAVKDDSGPSEEPPMGKPVVIAEFDTWRYHKTHEPRVFKAGEEIPEGWEGPESGLQKNWQRNADTGAFLRVR